MNNENVITEDRILFPAVEVFYAENSKPKEKFGDAFRSPAREIAPIAIENATIILNRAVIFDENKQIFEASLYLQRGFKPEATEILENATKNDGNSIIRISEPVLVTHSVSWRNYYHFLIQAAFSAWLLREKFGFKDYRLLLPRPSEAQISMLRIMGIEPENCIFGEIDKIYECKSSVSINTAYTEFVNRPTPLLKEFADFILEKTTKRKNWATQGLSFKRIFENFSKLFGNSSPKKIYVSRSDAKNRSIGNEADLEKMIATMGIKIVRLSGLSISKQAKLFHNADLIIAPHGAGLSNIIFCRPETKIIEFTADNYLNPCFLAIGQVLGLEYKVHVSPSTQNVSEQKDNIHLQSWNCELKSLKRLIEQNL